MHWCIWSVDERTYEFFYGKRLTYNSTDYTSMTGLVSFQETNKILVTNRNRKFNLSFLNFVIARSLNLNWHRVKQSTCSMRIKYSCFWKHKDGRVLWPIALNLWRIQKVKPWKPQIRRQNYQKETLQCPLMYIWCSLIYQGLKSIFVNFISSLNTSSASSDILYHIRSNFNNQRGYLNHQWQ